MADNSPNPKDLQQIEQYLRASGLSAQDLVNRMNAIKNSTADFNRELENAKRHFAELDDELNDLSRTFKNVLDDLRKWDDTSNRINRSYAKLGSFSDKLRYDARDLSRLSLQNIKDLDKKSKIELENLNERRKDLQLRYNSNDLSNKELDQLIELNGVFTESGRLRQDENNYAQRLLNIIQRRKLEEIKIIQTLGISGKLVDGIVNSLGKLGVSSEFFENLKDDMREAAKSGDKWKVITAATKGLISGIGDALTDPVTKLALLQQAFSFFLNAAINTSKQSVELGKNLGYGADNADRVQSNFRVIERTANNLNVTTANLNEAFNQLSESTGFVSEYSDDALTTQIKLTKQLGLTGDEAAGVYRFSVLTGQSSEATYQSMLRGYVATRNSLNVGVPFRAAMAEAAKVTGQLAANMGYNAENTIRGVVATKALGTSLEQAKSQGESLLDFQSSIENELKAELITGQQLNLERARAAALMGDQVTVAEELAAQGMTAAKFSGMNVIAQKSFAEALGTTSDELANQLAKREMALASGKSLAQITAEEADEAAKRQDIQEKFNAAMLKLQSVIGNLLAGPLGSFLEMLASGLDLINRMIYPLTAIGALYAGFNVAKQVGLGLDRAAFVLKGQEMGQVFFLNRQKEVGLLMDKQGLIARIAYNVQLASSAAIEGTISGAKKLQVGIETVLLSLKRSGLAITIREALNSIASAAMAAYESAAKIPGIGWILGGAAAAGVVGLGYSLMKDGVVDPNKGPVMTGEFGTVQMDPKDKAMYGADGKIKVGTNLLGDDNGKITSIKSTPAMDITPMVSAINQVTAAITKMNDKSWDVKLDSKSVGAGLIQNSYRSA
jgi:hypothetical protein